jgi:hypothetical protein
MVEQEYVALVDLSMLVMQLDAHPEQFFYPVERAYAPVIRARVELRGVIHVAFLEWLSSFSGRVTKRPANVDDKLLLN